MSGRRAGHWDRSLWQETVPPEAIKRFCLPCIYFSGYLLFLMASNPGLFICGSDLEFPFKTNSFNWGKHIYLKNNIQLIKLQE